MSVIAFTKKPSIARLECSSCGAATDAACNCGAPYVPAGARAAKAIAKNPQKSDRAIAADEGLNRETVVKARKQLARTIPVDERRTGLDGKIRKMPKPSARTKVKPTTVYKPVQEVNELLRDALEFMHKSHYRVNQWLSTNPSKKDRKALMDALHQVANHLSGLAQQAGGYSND